MSLTLYLAALAAASDPAASQAVNDSYRALSQARQANDIAGMASKFEAESLLIDSRPAPALSGSQLTAQLAPMVERLKSDGVKVHTRYRVEKRVIVGDTVIDAGFMKMMFEVPAPQAGKPVPRDMIRRFMVTWNRSEDGQWRILGDASFPATAEQFDSAKPQEGLYFE